MRRALYRPWTIDRIESRANVSSVDYIQARRRLVAPFANYGIPTINVPCGFSRGLPIGLQISGPRLGERVLALAHAYERATQWHRRQLGLA